MRVAVINDVTSYLSDCVQSTGSPPWCDSVSWTTLQLTQSTFVDLYLVLKVLAPYAHWGGVALFRLPIPLSCRAALVVWWAVWNGLPLVLLLPRTLSDTFYNHLKTVLFDRAQVGSTSE